MGGWSDRERIFAVAGIVLLALAGFMTLDRESDELTSYATGAALGSIAIGLTLAALARWAWIEYGDGLPPVTDWPNFLIVAGAIAALLSGARLAADDAPDRASASESACVAPKEGRLDKQLTMEVAPPALEQRLRSMTLEAAPAGYESFAGSATYFVVREPRGRTVGVVSAIPVDGASLNYDGADEDFARGVTDTLIAQGLVPAGDHVNGQAAVGVWMGRDYSLRTASGCHALEALTREPATSRRILQGLIPS